MKTSIVVLVTVLLGASGVLAADLGTAKDNFTTFCVKCHGPSGKGDGPSAATLKTKPRDFTDCTRMATISDDVMFKTIKEGGESAGLSKDMPPWKDGFDDTEIHDLVAYLHTLCKK